LRQSLHFLYRLVPIIENIFSVYAHMEKLTWPIVAEAWQLTRLEFLGADGPSFPDFDPFADLLDASRWKSLDRFANIALPSHPGYSCMLLKSTNVRLRLTSVLVQQEQRVGFICRYPEGCDVISLEPRVRGRGLAAPFILATMALRSRLYYQPIVAIQKATRGLFWGGRYTKVGFRAVAAAHRLAVQRAVARGRPVSEAVLADYPELWRPPRKAA
jgi:hypothetical protein